MADKDTSTVNMKLDADTKQDVQALAFIKNCSVQNLCVDLVKQGLKPYADKIAEAKKLRE